MSLADQLKLDVDTILGDTSGFARPATLTNSDGMSAVVNGHFTHVSQVLDPNSGVMINGSKASFTVSDAALVAAGIGKALGEGDPKRKPWTLQTVDAMGVNRRYKVYEVTPDRLSGCHVLMLELYKL